jgi:hypothetical protein
MARKNWLIGAFALMAALAVAGCNITPEHPVLEGDSGPSSLTPADEAVEMKEAESAAAAKNGKSK